MITLVTGATGFIGTHLVKELSEAGHQVIGVDISPPHPAAVMFLQSVASHITFELADLGVPGALQQVIQGPLDTVVHGISSGLGISSPERIVAVNVVSTLEVLRLARRAGAGRFIYISSSGVYGDTDPEVPITESHHLELTHAYPMAKYACEHITAWSAAQEGMTAASVRIAAPYGPMERPTRTRQAMSPIHSLVHAAIEGRMAEIHDPGMKRDWTHASDIARALRILVEHPALPYGCYNVSCGHVASLQTVADLLAQLVPQFAWKVDHAKRDAASVGTERRGPMDIQRLRDLGFVPRFSLQEGLGDTLNWVRSFRAAGIRLNDGFQRS
jgi:nucleoside-diphosphate-sugar epimerase